MANKSKIINAAQKYITKGQWDRAIKELQKLVADDPSDVRTLLKLGDVYSKKGDRENASKIYKQVAESYSEQGFFLKAVAVYKQILKHDAKHLDVTLKLAELYEHLGLQSEAMGQYQAAAQIHDERGDTAESLEVLERMVELDTENVASRIKLAESYSRETMVDKAAEQFERAASILKGQARIDDYIKVAERLVYHAPDRLEVVMELAKLYLKRGDTKRGLAKLQLCFKANPREIETLRLLAQAFNDLGQTQKTVFVYRELARIYDEANKPDEARSVLHMILEVDPNDSEARHTLGLSDPRVTAPVLEEPLFTPGETPMPEGASRPAYDAALLDSQSLIPSGAPSAPPAMAPSLAPRPPSGIQSGINYAPVDAGVPSDDEVLILDEPEEVSFSADLAPPPAPPAPAPAAYENVAKILTETDVYIKYGLREKALEHLRSVFDFDPDNVAAYYKMRDIYAAIGDNARAAESLANLLHVHARRGDVDALNAAREELRALAPGHPLVGGGLPGAIPPPLGGDAEDQISIDISEESDVFELVDFAEDSGADFAEDSNPPFDAADELMDEPFDAERNPSLDLPIDAAIEAPDFSSFDTVRPPDAHLRASDLADPNDDPTDSAASAFRPEAAFDLGSDAAMDPLPRSDSEELPVVTGSAIVMLEDIVEENETGIPTDEHPIIVSEISDISPFEPMDDGESETVALDEDSPLARAASELTAPARMRESAQNVQPSTDASVLDSATIEGDSLDPEIEDEIDEAEFLIQASLVDEARQALLDILGRAPGHVRALRMLTGLQPDHDVADNATILDDERTDHGPLSEAIPGTAELGAAMDAMSFGDAPEDDETTGEDHYDQGMAFKDLGRTDDAIREFEGALASERRRITSLEMIGHCYLEKNDPEQAIEFFAQAMEAGADGPALINLKYEIGAAYSVAGAMDDAVQWFYACARDDPDHRGVADRLRDMGINMSQDIDPPSLNSPRNGTYDSDAPSDAPSASKKSKISYL